jgi:hypothetical protein
MRIHVRNLLFFELKEDSEWGDLMLIKQTFVCRSIQFPFLFRWKQQCSDVLHDVLLEVKNISRRKYDTGLKLFVVQKLLESLNFSKALMRIMFCDWRKSSDVDRWTLLLSNQSKIQHSSVLLN